MLLLLCRCCWGDTGEEDTQEKEQASRLSSNSSSSRNNSLSNCKRWAGRRWARASLPATSCAAPARHRRACPRWPRIAAAAAAAGTAVVAIASAGPPAAQLPHTTGVRAPAGPTLLGGKKQVAGSRS